MKTEIEARFLYIDKDAMRTKLEAIGAELKQAEIKMVRKNYDFPDGELQSKGGWVRLRDEGNKITMTYKQLQSRSLSGVQESEVVVDSFEEADRILSALGLEAKSEQETLRESWLYKDAQIEIDTWPWMEPQLEIEAHSEELVRTIAAELGCDMSDALYGSVEVAYAAAYNVSESEVIELKTMRLDDPKPLCLKVK